MRDHAKAGIAEMLKLCPELLQLSQRHQLQSDAENVEEAADARYARLDLVSKKQHFGCVWKLEVCDCNALKSLLNVHRKESRLLSM